MPTKCRMLDTSRRIATKKKKEKKTGYLG